MAFKITSVYSADNYFALDNIKIVSWVTIINSLAYWSALSHFHVYLMN